MNSSSNSVTILTSHTKIWDPEIKAIDIVHAMMTHGHVTISLNSEGPSATAINLYRMLDHVCEKFNFDKKNITIVTCNREELHSEYTIKINPSYHISTLKIITKEKGIDKQDYLLKKNVLKNLFACFYNIPSWDRLCLLAHLKYKTSHKSLLACNGTWQAHEHNSYYLDTVTDYCPSEFANISRLVIDGIGPLSDHPGGKPSHIQNLDLFKYYNDFFIDVVAETYTDGLTFFPTEKTFRPIYAMTPFIVFGPQGFIGTLKSDYGFRSFDQWWDESYDDCQNYERIQKIYEVIDYIDRKSDSELQDMYHDMTDTLEYNFNRLKEIDAK
jgi:hypothetical protein